MYSYNKMVIYGICKYCTKLIKKRGKYSDCHDKCYDKINRYLFALQSIEDLDIIEIEHIKNELKRIQNK